ncbi:sodium/substrate symporter small subunit, partial [Pseudomonas saponiphila]
MGFENNDKAKGYWRENIRLVLSLLAIWAAVSFGCGILLVDVLNEVHF